MARGPDREVEGHERGDVGLVAGFENAAPCGGVFDRASPYAVLRERGRVDGLGPVVGLDGGGQGGGEEGSESCEGGGELHSILEEEMELK